MEKALIVFVRNPDLGFVKTRIAKTAGDEQALVIYLHLLARTQEIASKTDADTFVFYSKEVIPDDSWSGPRFIKEKQSNGDLGERMRAAFDVVFSKGYHKVCIVGSDCYDLTPHIIERAFEKLDRCELVAGPAKDGGYYLLGMKQPNPAVFALKAWSTDTVLKETLAIADELHLSYKLLGVLSDIDTEADWLAALQLNP